MIQCRYIEFTFMDFHHLLFRVLLSAYQNNLIIIKLKFELRSSAIAVYSKLTKFNNTMKGTRKKRRPRGDRPRHSEKDMPTEESMNTPLYETQGKNWINYPGNNRDSYRYFNPSGNPLDKPKRLKRSPERVKRKEEKRFPSP